MVAPAHETIVGTGEPRSLRSGRPVWFVVVAGLLSAAGCQTQSANPFIAAAVDPDTGSSVNIGSLSTVIAKNPTDANGYNVRGTAYGNRVKNRPR